LSNWLRKIISQFRLFEETLNNDAKQSIYGIYQTHDDAYLIFGKEEIKDKNDYRYKAILIKINSDGKLMWNKSYDDVHKLVFTSVIESPQNQFIAAGYEQSMDSEKKITLRKINQVGQVIKTKKVGYDNQSMLAKKIINTSDGGLILVGLITSKDMKKDIIVIKLDSEMNKQWEKRIGGKENENISSIIELQRGGYVMVGSKGKMDDFYNDILIIKLDADGQKVISQTYGGLRDYIGKDIIQTDDGFIVVGKKEKKNNYADVLVLKLDSDFKKIWQKNLGGKAWSEGIGIINNGKNYIIGANTNSGGSFDAWFICIDENGNKIWDKTYGGEKRDMITGFIKTSDGGFVATGYNNSENDKKNIWLIKLNREGKLEKN